MTVLAAVPCRRYLRLNDARIHVLQGLIVYSPALHYVGRKVIYHHIADLYQFKEQFFGLRTAHVKRNAAFASVPCAGVGIVVCFRSLGCCKALDLYDFSSVICKQSRSKRP